MANVYKDLPEMLAHLRGKVEKIEPKEYKGKPKKASSSKGKKKEEKCTTN